MEITNCAAIDFKSLRNDITEALKLVAEKHGIKTLKAGNVTYDDSTFTFKLLGEAFPSALSESNLSMFLQMKGLPSDTVGKMFTQNGVAYSVKDVNMKKPKNCIILSRVSDGKGFICSAEALKNAIEIR